MMRKVYFKPERSTKRTIRFQEVGNELGVGVAIGVLYVQKDALSMIEYKYGDVLVLSLMEKGEDEE